jgi:predicted lipoprotein with Yx(FWY)xxD motif
MPRIFLLVPALLCASVLAFGAEPAAEPEAGAPPIRKFEGHLVDLKGRGIYTWDGDKTPGRSSCNSQCRILWPPITAADDAKPRGSVSLVARDDGSRPWALKGRPLYRWASDKKHGDAGGDGVGDVWHLVLVGAKPAAPAATTATSTTSATKNPNEGSSR